MGQCFDGIAKSMSKTPDDSTAEDLRSHSSQVPLKPTCEFPHYQSSSIFNQRIGYNKPCISPALTSGSMTIFIKEAHSLLV